MVCDLKNHDWRASLVVIRGQTTVEWCICFRTTLPESMLSLAICFPKVLCSCEGVSGNFVARYTLSLTKVERCM